MYAVLFSFFITYNFAIELISFCLFDNLQETVTLFKFKLSLLSLFELTTYVQI